MKRVRQAGAIVLREHEGVKEVLLVRAKKDPALWIFPKGHIDSGESSADAALRELQEEAGVVGARPRRVGVSTFQSGSEPVEVTYYLADFAGTAPPSETRSVQWLPLEAAKSALSFDDACRLLDEAARLSAREDRE
jgi:8-oxo-(d)GTP phosphatase